VRGIATPLTVLVHQSSYSDLAARAALRSNAMKKFEKRPRRAVHLIDTFLSVLAPTAAHVGANTDAISAGSRSSASTPLRLQCRLIQFSRSSCRVLHALYDE